MDALVRQAADAASIDYPNARILFAPLPAADGDAVLVRQVWANLISNACKFSAGRADAVVQIGASERDGMATYWVRDQGVGFDMAYANKLFRPFERLHTEKEFEGIGIGLALVKRIVERHGGEVGAESAPGEGATFWFTLSAAAKR
jgi:light-regulated signal transduction histidine kinase (bacteriophytochrome)